VGGGGSGTQLRLHVHARCRKPALPPTLHVAWHAHVHAGVAVPGTLSKLQHSPASSRVRNPYAMRVRLVVGCARLGLAVHSPCSRCAPLFLASNKDVGFVNLSAVFLWCLVGGCWPARCVSSCRRVSQFVCDDGWFSAVGVRSAVAVSNVLPTQRPIRCPLVLRVAVVA
jgi:hypothetical protein